MFRPHGDPYQSEEDTDDAVTECLRGKPGKVK
jgi:hypothetical protein